MAIKNSNRADLTPPISASLELRFRWWLGPLASLSLITGLTAAISVLLPASTYGTWEVRKYLGTWESALLLFGIAVCAGGILVGHQGAPSRATRTIALSSDQIAWMSKAFRISFGLALFGYLMWFALAISQGVGLADLSAVVNREGSAIGQLKSNSRPVGGLTTWTQLGPIAVALGTLLKRLDRPVRGVGLIVGLSAMRTLFYAERLALLETLIPLIFILAITIGPQDRGYKMIRLAPFVAPPAVWALFAISEYTRSWVYYQTFTTQPFLEWVTVRMLGYYTTSFNNSALLYSYLPSDSAPYFSVDAFWNAPGMGALFTPGAIGTVAADSWWSSTLQSAANYDFTNTGSFLVVFAEFGLVVGALLLFALGYTYGRMYRGGIQGSLPAIIGYGTLLVGLLELPRFNYITLGRCTPILLALFVIALTFPKRSSRSD